MSEHNTNEWQFATRAIHVGQEPDPLTGATIPPIHLTSTYTQASPGQHQGFEYSRSGNPTRARLEEYLRAQAYGTGYQDEVCEKYKGKCGFLKDIRAANCRMPWNKGLQNSVRPLTIS